MTRNSFAVKSLSRRAPASYWEWLPLTKARQAFANSPLWTWPLGLRQFCAPANAIDLARSRPRQAMRVGKFHM